MDCKLIMTVEEMKDRAAWLRMRSGGIGGSDAAVIAGLSPWKSPYELYLEKTGEAAAPDLSDNERVYWGTVPRGDRGKGVHQAHREEGV